MCIISVRHKPLSSNRHAVNHYPVETGRKHIVVYNAPNRTDSYAHIRLVIRPHQVCDIPCATCDNPISSFCFANHYFLEIGRYTHTSASHTFPHHHLWFLESRRLVNAHEITVTCTHCTDLIVYNFLETLSWTFSHSKCYNLSCVSTLSVFETAKQNYNKRERESTCMDNEPYMEERNNDFIIALTWSHCDTLCPGAVCAVCAVCVQSEREWTAHNDDDKREETNWDENNMSWMTAIKIIWRCVAKRSNRSGDCARKSSINDKM